MKISRQLSAFSVQLAMMFLLTGCTISAQEGGIIIAIVAGFCLLFGALAISGMI